MESQRITTPKASRTIEVTKKKPDDTTPSITELLQQSKAPAAQRKASAPVIQRMLFKNPGDARALVDSQKSLQKNGTPQFVAKELYNENRHVKKNVHADPNFFTTVGFEFEFIQLEDEKRRIEAEGKIEKDAEAKIEIIKKTKQKAAAAEAEKEVRTEAEELKKEERRKINCVLQNVIHAKLGKSAEPFRYTGLPFTLETDASGTIELVTPPFIIDTLPGTSVPDADDVEKADHLMENELSIIVDGSDTVEKMIGGLSRRMGINFYGLYSKITAENMLGPMSPELEKEEVVGKKKNRILDWDDLKGLKVGHSEKIPADSRPPSGIATQVNIAMTTEDYQKMADMPSIGVNMQMFIDENKPELVKRLTGKISTKLEFQSSEYIDLKSGLFGLLISEIAMYLINTKALHAMEMFRENGRRYFGGHLDKLKDSGLESSVKDFRGVWLKDSVRSLAVDVFRDCDFHIILAFSEGLELITEWDVLNFSKEAVDAAKSLASFLKNLSKSHVSNGKRTVSQSEIVGTRVRGLCERGSGANEFDARPDTQLPSEDLPVAPGLVNTDGTSKRLHVVESRHYSSREMVERLRLLKYEI